VVVSALGGVTDQLLQAGSLAADGNESYKDILLGIEKGIWKLLKPYYP